MAKKSKREQALMDNKKATAKALGVPRTSLKLNPKMNIYKTGKKGLKMLKEGTREIKIAEKRKK